MKNRFLIVLIYSILLVIIQIIILKPVSVNYSRLLFSHIPNTCSFNFHLLSAPTLLKTPSARGQTCTLELGRIISATEMAALEGCHDLALTCSCQQLPAPRSNLHVSSKYRRANYSQIIILVTAAKLIAFLRFHCSKVLGDVFQRTLTVQLQKA